MIRCHHRSHQSSLVLDPHVLELPCSDVFLVWDCISGLLWWMLVVVCNQCGYEFLAIVVVVLQVMMRI